MSQTKAQLIDPVDGTIVNADINASAAIDGSKISPVFTANTTIQNTHPKLFLTDTNSNSDFSLENVNGVFTVVDQTNTADRLAIDSNGNVGIKGGTPLHELHVFGTATTLAITDNAASSSSVSTILFRNRDGNSNFRDIATIEGESAGNGGYGAIAFNTAFNNTLSERMRLDKDGRVLIGTTNNTPAANDTAGIVFGDNTAGVAKTGVASFCCDGAAPLLLTRLTSDGNILGIANDNGTKALLRTNSNDFEITAIEDLRLSTGSGHTERIRLTNGGNLGIGTTAPSTQLHISASGSSTQMRIENTNADFLIQAGDTGDDGLHFYDLDNSAYRMMISNNGKVGIGTTAPNTLLHIQGSNNNGDLEALRLHNANTGSQTKTTLAFTNTTDATVEHAKLTATRDNSGRLDFFVGAQSHAVLCVDGFASGVVGVNTVQASKALDVNGEIRTNTGLLFGSDTAAANRLSDYEEGSFSPAFKAENNSSSATTSVAEAKYTKIGDVVHFILFITLTAHASGTTGGTARISGLPFTPGGRHSAISVGYYQHFNANQTWFGGTVQPSQSQILLRHLVGGSAATGSANMDYDNNLKPTSQVIITGTYTTN